MKKIILLIFIPLFLGGCYDYNGLNDLAIISGIAIDYEDEEFTVTFEIISTKKEGETSASSNTYYVTSTASNIVYAFTQAANKMDKVPYFEHVEVVIFSQTVAKSHLTECIDYLIRSEKLRNEFYASVSENKAADILMASTEEHPIVSTYLTDLLEYNSETYNAGYYAPFTKTVNSILTDGLDAMLPVFTLNQDEVIELVGLSVFKDYNLVGIFTIDEASVINLLNNFESKSIHFKMTCGNEEEVVITIYEGDVKIEANEDDFVVKATLNAQISELTCNYDLKEASSYTDLEEEFTAIVIAKMDKVLKELQQLESNVLNIGRSYYNKYRIENFYLWTTQDIKYDIDLKINKKGLTFEVD